MVPISTPNKPVRAEGAISEMLLSVTGGTVSISGRIIFYDAHLSVAPGEMIALTGASGSGKTTLLNCLGTLADFSAGEYSFRGVRLSGASARTRRHFRRDSLGYLFQNYALVEGENVEKNILGPLAVMPRSQRPSRKELESVLTRVGLSGREKSLIYQLSGGEQQRVALAGLMLKQPSLILADEPTGALDAENEAQVLDILRELVNAGACAIIATHSDAVADFCDRRIDMSQFKG